ncbi:SAM-dependent methyltransferase [Actinoplanes sp. L3-i22]|uniref:SAM-dependent methyltransferase n=1 Tax=Actinoplanes sp. L3-i22 TaxID=2836373 RepID=UPI001C864E23|nr:SAM-dependent methyltransferase [Actinoplanes sp. L3-i22]
MGVDQNSIIDTSVAHPARRYQYWLGGKDNFAADRESGDAIEKLHPYIRLSARENRWFLHRAVRYLAKEAGVRQFLDIGTGLPLTPNTHEVAQTVEPAARIVYVDNDPLVLSHARALLTSHPAGRTAYIDADLTDPAKILGGPTLTNVLDLREPVGLLLVAVLHFLPDDVQAYTAVNTLMQALPAGSYLAASHATYDFMDADVTRAFTTKSVTGAEGFIGRSRTKFLRFFDGLDLVNPGVTAVSDWRRDSADTPKAEDVSVYGAVAIKPESSA